MHFKRSFDNAKQSFFRSFNSVYGKIGGFAKDELLIHLVKSKCLPSLLYATEALPLSKADIPRGNCNCNVFVNASYFDTFTHRLRGADGLPWWSPSQVLITN